jgi:hypothetical protein
MNTNLLGRLKNTSLPKSHALLPLFEAVINSIHSIEESESNIEESFIKIEIIRSNQKILEFNSVEEQKSKITGFRITDNGVGFNEDNFKSFQTLDTDYKAEKGGRGIGRLLWLKAFEKVKIESSFIASDKLKKKRSFDFGIYNDIANETLIPLENKDKIRTTVELLNFKETYLSHSKKTAESIGKSLLEHSLWYFIREGGSPTITIIDDTEKINLDQLFENYMLESSNTEEIIIKDKTFNLIHVKLLSNVSNHHSIVYCAANRVVKEENIRGKVSGLFDTLKDGDKEFIYLGFITSYFLDETVRPERIGFDINEDIDGLFEESEISFKDIRMNIIVKITEYLNEYLLENKEKGKKRLVDFINQQAPKYKPIIKNLSENDLIVDPKINNKDLELKLHKHLSDIEGELLEEGHSLLQEVNLEKLDDYEKKLNNYLSKASDIKRSDLASYVSHRKVVIDLLNQAIKKQPDGKYVKENFIHQLIMPMQKESRELSFDDSNLWLVDERLAFHNYLASDKTLISIPITDSDKTKEPDLLGINIFDNPLLINEKEEFPLASLTVVEIKRPMRNDATSGETKDPIEQALGYLKRVREGKVTTPSGRPIPNSEDIPGFCYILCDLTPTIIHRCELLDLKVTFDKMGYFGFHKSYNAYIEVISFDKLVKSAKERNKAFFDKLGFPS